MKNSLRPFLSTLIISAAFLISHTAYADSAINELQASYNYLVNANTNGYSGPQNPDSNLS